MDVRVYLGEAFDAISGFRGILRDIDGNY